MKKIFLLSFLVVSTNIFSQELDDSYLQSLPENIRGDVLEKIEAKEELDKPVYRRASTFIDKDEAENTNNANKTLLFGSDLITAAPAALEFNCANLPDA